MNFTLTLLSVTCFFLVCVYTVSMAEYKNYVALPDTSALMKNPNLLENLLVDFKEVVISKTVIRELNYQKDKKENNSAWLAMTKIEKLREKLIQRDDPNCVCENNDQKIIALAKLYAKDKNTKVFIIHDDVGISLEYADTILLYDYLSEQKNNYMSDKWGGVKTFLSSETYNIIPPKVNLNFFLEDGYTPLISCIRSKHSFKYEKLLLLINSGECDLNKTDNSKYFLTPLSHCIQINDYRAFCMLLDYGADYNKGSINETKSSYIKCRNEGNTPLMIACWHGRRKFVEKLCSYADIGLNQQDSNGYTPLMKSAIKKNHAIYHYLLSFPRTDIFIRDRNNHCAEWFLTHREGE